MLFDTEKYRSIYRDGLLNDTLPFWISNGVDLQYGGIMTSLDRDASIIDTDKSVWHQGRFTWMLAEMYNNVERRDEWLELAIQGAEFMDRYCFDPKDGRMWFHVTREGLPIRKRRYAFSESFAAIAYGELAKATGESRYAEKALRTFERFVQHNQLSPDASHEFAPKFTSTRPTRGIGFPMITIHTAQQLRDSINLPFADRFIDDAIATIRQFHVHEDIQCVMEVVSQDGQRIDHFDGRTLNPGHAIEGAWFIMAEGHHRKDAKLVKLGCQMLDWMWQRGWDPVHGGMLYFTSVDEKPIQEYWHDMKFWWPHNETIIACLLAYLLTGDQKYAAWHQLVHDWSYAHFPDAEHGEWYGYLRRDGSVSNRLKGNLWKGLFHLPRMQLFCWQWLAEREIGKAVD